MADKAYVVVLDREERYLVKRYVEKRGLTVEEFMRICAVDRVGKDVEKEAFSATGTGRLGTIGK